MVIGLDLSVLQTPHRMRGIGSVAINFIKNIPSEAKKEHKFVFFLYEKGFDDVSSMLDLEAQGLDYEVRFIEEVKSIGLRLPGPLRKINRLLNSAMSVNRIYRGDERIKDLDDVSHFIQFDQMCPSPRSHRVTSTLIIYDLIPYVLQADYLQSYRTARASGSSRKSSLRKAYERRSYITKVKNNSKRANRLIAISDHTKQDFIKYLGIKPSKISVVHLGVDNSTEAKDLRKLDFERYIDTSWGYIKRPVRLDDKPFLLFVGGADPRRKLQDLVIAYNHLKAQGHDIRLVLAGDTMKGPLAIPTLPIQHSLARSSYLKDIVFLGFVTNDQREWLYKNTIAFVYPTLYEGFGLPVLESMAKGTPVITYNNSSLSEIASDAALFTNNASGIFDAVIKLLNDSDLRKLYAKKGRAQASEYLWPKTVASIIERATKD